MLSPNARKFVADKRVGPNTRTVKLHATAFISASVTVQATVLRPIGNAEPDGGEHANDNGRIPPDACGRENATATGPPVIDCVVTGAGQATVGFGAAPRFGDACAC